MQGSAAFIHVVWKCGNDFLGSTKYINFFAELCDIKLLRLLVNFQKLQYRQQLFVTLQNRVLISIPGLSFKKMR